MPTINTSKLIGLEHYISEEEYLYPHATGEFTSLMHELLFAARVIERDVRRAGLSDIVGLTEDVNTSGDKVKKLDKYANEAIIKIMSKCGHICVMASEEEDEIIKIENGHRIGRYVLVFDPLDGSKNIDIGVSIGTIFSLYKRLDPQSRTPGTLVDILQPGYKQVAAGYILYGSSTTFVYTTGNGVNEFTYDPTLGEFLLTYENVKIPRKGYYFSCNEGNYYYWSEEFRRFHDFIKNPTNHEKPYTLRYIGTGVADIHRTIHYGGIYLYPGDSTKPDGRFRLVYEANALAMIMEQAGGLATNGYQRILDIKPREIHQCVPLFIGSMENVQEAMNHLKQT